MHYLLGCASKYLTRWRKKNGLEDLEKSRHYYVKAKERQIRCEVTGLRLSIHHNFFKSNNIPRDESDIMYLAFQGLYDEALRILDRLIDTERSNPTSRYVDQG